MMSVAEMGDMHLLNTMAFLRRKAAKLYLSTFDYKTSHVKPKDLLPRVYWLMMDEYIARNRGEIDYEEISGARILEL